MEEIVVILCVCTAGRGCIFEVGRQSRVGALEVQQFYGRAENCFVNCPDI